jgi:hypothetical protein
MYVHKLINSDKSQIFACNLIEECDKNAKLLKIEEV